eukprot:Rhum_TRINITY_DN6631_c0_g1::Rhum_TRINITY_DN6631_c0_g1_i1::g.20628::m.20628
MRRSWLAVSSAQLLLRRGTCSLRRHVRPASRAGAPARCEPRNETDVFLNTPACCADATGSQAEVLLPAESGPPPLLAGEHLSVPAWMSQLRLVVERARGAAEARGGSIDGRVVTCGVVASEATVRGVNFALHEVLAPAGLERNMLHGCAEHNALAAALAQGLDLSTVTSLALYAENSDKVATEAPVPCTSCARKILKVADCVSHGSMAVHLLTPCTSLAKGTMAPAPPCVKAGERLRHPSITLHSWYIAV